MDEIVIWKDDKVRCLVGLKGQRDIRARVGQRCNGGVEGKWNANDRLEADQANASLGCFSPC